MTIGIYNIKHKDDPKKCYIGSSKNCNQRFITHRYNVKKMLSVVKFMKQ